MNKSFGYICIYKFQNNSNKLFNHLYKFIFWISAPPTHLILIINFRHMSMRKVRYYWLHTIIDFLLCSHVEKRVKFLIACCTIQHKLLRKNTENQIHVFAYKCYYYLLIYIRMFLVMKRSFIKQSQCWVYWSWVAKYIQYCVEKRKYDGMRLFFLLTAKSTQRILIKLRIKRAKFYSQILTWEKRCVTRHSCIQQRHINIIISKTYNKVRFRNIFYLNITYVEL